MANDQDAMIDLLKSIESDSSISADLKARVDALIKGLGVPPALENDIWIYRMVVMILGLVILGTVAGGLFLSFKGDPNYKLPSEIVAIGSAAVGALAGLLAPSPTDRK